MTRSTIRAVAHIQDDEDAFDLTIDLMDDRSIILSYPKSNGRFGKWPWVTLFTRNCDCRFDEEEITPDEFEDWAKIAIGAMPPERERRWLCQICNDKQGFGPMLPDEVWNAIAPNPRGLMCLDCMRTRSTACLGRTLAEATS
jgi:hypothetical protein